MPADAKVHQDSVHEDHADDSAPRCGHVPGLDGQEHVVAPAHAWPWLPKVGEGELAKHPYCEECGLVRVVGKESAMKMGGLINLLSDLQRRFKKDGRKITEAQKRLIIKKLEAQGAGDRFGLPLSGQMDLFVEAVCAYTGASEEYVRGLLRARHG